MLSIQDNLDMLRGRFMRLRVGKGDLQVLARAVGVSPSVLKAFVRGQSIALGSLQTIETWCDREESSHAGQ